MGAMTSLFAPLSNAFFWLLQLLHNSLGISWSWAIVLLTVIVRIILIPLTWRQLKSMRAMQALAPQMRELQQKYKHDRQLLNQKTMEFYQENKVSPFGSCLPLLLQLPVFLGLFYMLRAAGVPAGEALSSSSAGQFLPPPDGVGPVSWLWIADITKFDLILMFLYVASQFVASWQMARRGMGQQKVIAYAMPVMIGVFMYVGKWPAGLFIYWFTSNIWTIAQQLLAEKLLPYPAAAVAAGADAGKRGKVVPAKSASTKAAPGKAASGKTASAKTGPAKATQSQARSEKTPPGKPVAGKRPAAKAPPGKTARKGTGQAVTTTGEATTGKAAVRKAPAGKVPATPGGGGGARTKAGSGGGAGGAGGGKTAGTAPIARPTSSKTAPGKRTPGGSGPAKTASAKGAGPAKAAPPKTAAPTEGTPQKTATPGARPAGAASTKRAADGAVPANAAAVKIPAAEETPARTTPSQAPSGDEPTGESGGNSSVETTGKQRQATAGQGERPHGGAGGTEGSGGA